MTYAVFDTAAKKVKTEALFHV